MFKPFVLKGIFFGLLFLLSGSEILVMKSLQQAAKTVIFLPPAPSIFGKLENTTLHLASLRRSSATRNSGLRWEEINYKLQDSNHWQSLFPTNWNHIHLDNSTDAEVQIAMYSQLDCLNKIRIELLTLQDPAHTAPPVQTLEETDTCFGQIRQAILCAADITLEPTLPFYIGDHYEISATGLEEYHRCYDWTAVRMLTEML